MCSIAMPGELMLAHGPYARRPLFRSVGTIGQQHAAATMSPRSVPPPPPPPPPSSPSLSPRIRPCLSSSIILEGLRGGCAKDENEIVVVASAGDAVANRRKQKRVVFADDRGRPLTQVRIMSEPSNVPPAWTGAYLASVARGRGGRGQETEKSSLVARWCLSSSLTSSSPSSSTSASSPSSPPTASSLSSSWEMSFVQPASDYLAFRRKLDEKAVSLENVIIRESEECLVGTIKVKNLAYDKEIVVRASSDGWSTREDLHCSYIEQQPIARAALVLYDTFRFRLTLPLKSERIEFCVRYRVGGGDAGVSEYWDNNDEKNYVVRRKQQPSEQNGPTGIAVIGDTMIFQDSQSIVTRNLASFVSPRDSKDQQVTRITDATRANIMTWSEFASWQHLNNEAPYW